MFNESSRWMVMILCECISIFIMFGVFSFEIACNAM